MTPLERMVSAGIGAYEVHVYHDTGKGKRGKQVIAPQVPFGYLVKNDKPVAGYRTELIGLSSDAVPVSENFYRISARNARSRKEAANNPIRIATRIEPRQPEAPADCPKCPVCPSCPPAPPPPSAAGRALWIVLALLAGILLGLWMGRRRE